MYQIEVTYRYCDPGTGFWIKAKSPILHSESKSRTSVNKAVRAWRSQFPKIEIVKITVD